MTRLLPVVLLLGVVQEQAELHALAGELAGLKAEGGTALYDSIVFSLYYFTGIRGQRALLILSDGQDQSSRYAFEEALEYAQTVGGSSVHRPGWFRCPF